MEDLRPSLTLYAYNILGSYEDAKDIVQDVFLKFTQLNADKIADKKSYLIRMVVNLAIDHKRRLKKQLEQYAGPWLPEPLATDDPAFALHRKEILSYSLLVLLEKLDSKQRAVFILKEGFDYDHDEVAEVLGITAENSRKILSRARAELRDDLKITPDEKQIETVSRYLEVLDTGDLKKLERMLHEDISVTSDGGGKVAALRNVIRGTAHAVALVSGLHRKKYSTVRSEIRIINHQPAIFFFDGDQIITCQIFDIEVGRVRNIFFVRNPDKLEILQKDFRKVVTNSRGLRHECKKTVMERISYNEMPEGLLKGLLASQNYVDNSGLDIKLLELMRMRVSHINNCAYCLDMHFKEGIEAGETPLRLISVSAWRETSYYTPKEQAVLAFAETLTYMPQDHSSEGLHDELLKYFSKQEIALLTLAIIQINSWNRLVRSFGTVAGNYQVKKKTQAA